MTSGHLLRLSRNWVENDRRRSAHR